MAVPAAAPPTLPAVVLPQRPSVSDYLVSVCLPPDVAEEVASRLDHMGYDDPADYRNLDAVELAEIERDLLAANVKRPHVRKLVRHIKLEAQPAAPVAPC